MRNKSSKPVASILAFPESSQITVRPDKVQTETSGKLQILKDMAAAISTAAEILEEREQENIAKAKFEENIDFYKEVSEFETKLIQKAMAQTHGNQKRAA